MKISQLLKKTSSNEEVDQMVELLESGNFITPAIAKRLVRLIEMCEDDIDTYVRDGLFVVDKKDIIELRLYDINDIINVDVYIEKWDTIKYKDGKLILASDVDPRNYAVCKKCKFEKVHF